MRIEMALAFALLPCLVSAQTSGLPALKEELAGESAARAIADAALQRQVDLLAGKEQVATETANRAAADAALQSSMQQLASKEALTAEIANRTNSDVTLQEQITALQQALASVQEGKAEPKRFTAGGNCMSTDFPSSCYTAVFTVPAGKVFVVEQVVGYVYRGDVGLGEILFLGNNAVHLARLYCRTLTANQADCNQATKLHLEGTVFMAAISTNGSPTNTNRTSTSISLYGYLADP